jgi:hypothetical protein
MNTYLSLVEEDMIWGKQFEKENDIGIDTNGTIGRTCRVFGFQSTDL